MPKIETMKVGEIEDQGDRILIHPAAGQEAVLDIGAVKVRVKEVKRGSFCVIASHLQAAGIGPGDEITYEPYGFNFGWFVSASR